MCYNYKLSLWNTRNTDSTLTSSMKDNSHYQYFIYDIAMIEVYPDSMLE